MTIEKIIKYDLCVGCGLCSSVLGHDHCVMSLSKEGFYKPELKAGTDDKLIKKLCPGICVRDQKKNKNIWGDVRCVHESWSSDPHIRFKAASGGVVTGVALFVLENNIADAILQVGAVEGDYIKNEMKISRTRDDVINNAQSRYAPAMTLYKLKQILEGSTEKYAIIGKPCDIAGVKNFVIENPCYSNRFVLYISIFCAGMPSYNATDKVWKLSGKDKNPKSIQYRGNGWPGNFVALWDDNSRFELSYNESWGKILGRNLGYRCKICPDGIGSLADLAVGDSWNTRNGYPDFSEQEGKCFVFVRTKQGQKIFNQAVLSNYITSKEIPVEIIRDMQPYQYERRALAGWRILPIQLATFFFLNFKGLGLAKIALKANTIKGIKNLIGSTKRLLVSKSR